MSQRLTHKPHPIVRSLQKSLLLFTKVPVLLVTPKAALRREPEGRRPAHDTVEMSQKSYGALLESLDGFRIRILALKVHLPRVLLIPLREHGTAVEQDEYSQVHRKPNVVRPPLEEVVQQFPDAFATGSQKPVVEYALQLSSHDRRSRNMSAPTRRWVMCHLRHAQGFFAHNSVRERCQATRNPKAESFYDQR